MARIALGRGRVLRSSACFETALRDAPDEADDHRRRGAYFRARFFFARFTVS